MTGFETFLAHAHFFITESQELTLKPAVTATLECE